MRKGSPSILPNSSARILKPMADGLIIRWHDERDTHVLYQYDVPLAAHHNGFSCHVLAEYMLRGDAERACKQLDCISACGGKVYVSRAEITERVSKGE